MIPMPFSRVLVRVGKLIPVPQDATNEDVERYTTELQAALDRVAICRSQCETRWDGEFPYCREG